MSVPGMSVIEGHTATKGWEEFKDKFWEFIKVNPHAEEECYVGYRKKFKTGILLGWRSGHFKIFIVMYTV